MNANKSPLKPFASALVILAIHFATFGLMSIWYPDVWSEGGTLVPFVAAYWYYKGRVD